MRRRVVAGHVALVAVQVFFGLFPIFGTLALAPGGVREVWPSLSSVQRYSH